jgi:hypothetical protein
MRHLTDTIREALDHAPPEHLELVLTALIEARFTVWPKEVRDRCALPANLPRLTTEGTSE